MRSARALPGGIEGVVGFIAIPANRLAWHNAPSGRIGALNFGETMTKGELIKALEPFSDETEIFRAAPDKYGDMT